MHQAPGRRSFTTFRRGGVSRRLHGELSMRQSRRHDRLRRLKPPLPWISAIPFRGESRMKQRFFATMWLLTALVLSVSASARASKLVLVAGGGNGADDGRASSAKLQTPFAITSDKDGNLYILEYT